MACELHPMCSQEAKSINQLIMCFTNRNSRGITSFRQDLQPTGVILRHNPPHESLSLQKICSFYTASVAKRLAGFGKSGSQGRPWLKLPEVAESGRMWMVELLETVGGMQRTYAIVEFYDVLISGCQDGITQSELDSQWHSIRAMMSAIRHSIKSKPGKISCCHNSSVAFSNNL